MRKVILSTLFFLSLFTVNAQEESFREAFLDANTLMEENQYNRALTKWLQLYEEQPNNANINYRIGKCYINSANDKKKALSYLITAAQSTTKNFNPYTSSEKNAPVEAFFFLGRAYHINYQLDNAIINYNSFKNKVSKKHYLYDDIDNNIQQCKNAKIALKNPVNISVENIGTSINSEYADYSPVLSIDESTIYFTSRRVRPDSSNINVFDYADGYHFEDIYISHNYDGEWTEPTLLNISSSGHEAIINISADGETLFIYKDDKSDGNIYTSSKDGDEWSSPKKLASDINLNSTETHVHISPDGNLLYFISDRKNGIGGKDIYFCKKLPNGEWAKAQNFGEAVNTSFDEDGLFVHPSGKTIYFSSNGSKSIGGYDIFRTTMDDLGNWSEPVNLGYPINSADDDVFFVTSADGKRGYFSSFKENGFGEKDIYRISLDDNTIAGPLTLLLGTMRIVGEETLPDDATVVVTEKGTGETIGIYSPRKRDGKFSLILSPGNDFNIVYSAGGFKQEEDLHLEPTSAYREINRAIVLDDVIFNDNKPNNTDNTVDPSNNSSSGNVSELQNEIADLKNQIQVLKSQAGDNNVDPIITTNSDDNVKDLQKEISSLKEEIERLKNNNGNYIAPTPVVITDALAYYQEFFNYNVKDVSTSAPKYQDMLNKAFEASKKGKVIIDIESSASKVPTTTYGSNHNLAYERAKNAQRTITKSLIAKGVNKKDIIINEITSGIKGPEYNGDHRNSGMYEQYQYVIIKIK